MVRIFAATRRARDASKMVKQKFREKNKRNEEKKVSYLLLLRGITLLARDTLT